MMKHALGGLAVAVGTAGPAFAQVAGVPIVTADRSYTSSTPVKTSAAAPARGAKLGRPVVAPAVASVPSVPSSPALIPASALAAAAASDLAPTASELGGTPAGFGAAAGDCPADGAPGCGPCGPAGRVWTNFEYLYWVSSGQPLPPLATAAPVGTPLATAGVLGQPTTSVLFGGRRVNNDWRSGFRGSAGFWIDPDQTVGLEADFFFLGRTSDRFTAGSSDGSSVVTRPFFNALLGRADTELVSFPGVLAGRTTADPSTSAIGGGVNGRFNLCCDPCGRVDFLAGYRYFNVTDQVTITEDLTALPGSGVPGGTRFVIQDRFKTTNDFHGGVLGLAGERRFGSFFVGVRGSVALGNVRQTTEVAGATAIVPPGGTPAVFSGGLLAQPSNIGRYTHNAFAVLPELGVKLGVQLTEHARVHAGYNFIYLSDVARAGDQIDTRVNPTQLPPRGVVTGPLSPAFTRNPTDYWLQGFTVGAELRF